ncbi:LuxR family transcriptional regulator [Kaistia adipata]|uniref:LuxR family transcriptional regulator n=1 Tax=Kaistia adipata TaxID=166954 RepID=UPI00048D0D60|nr:LuxR family transcriptional regulator [Kaistia adipata]
MHLLEVTARYVSSICDAGNKLELQSVVYAAVRALGFDSFNLACEKRAKHEFMTDPTLTNWSCDELIAYEREGWSERDPLLEYAATGAGPLCWRRGTWDDPARSEYHEYIKHVGITGGLTIPLRGGAERIGALTLLTFSDREPPADALHAASILGMVARSRGAAIGLVTGQPSGAGAKFRSLSCLQREILKWVAHGKSNAEIALIVGQSKRSVDYHVIEILKKLEVGSRAQAAAIYASL